MTRTTRSTRTRTRPRTTAAAVAVLALVLAGCGGDDEADPGESGTAVAAESTTAGDDGATTDEETSTTEAAAPLQVLVTNDDGYSAEGIDVVVEALEGWGAEVTVVAPLEQQSGTGGTFTEGPVATSDETTASGADVLAVDGFPSDTVRVAVDEEGLTPDLVVSGINEGQNLGAIVDISGTVGAARAAVARGIPALALSAGVAEGDAEATSAAYAEGAELMVDWITEREDALRAGEAPVEVTSINIPACTAGEVRGLVEVPLATDGEFIAPQDCTSTLEDPPDDAVAFNNGYATETVVPDEPATPPQPG